MRLLIADLFLKLYRYLLSPALHLMVGEGYGCRFEPSCSLYSHQAIVQHGILRGGILALKRLLRCHPWNSASTPHHREE